MTCDLAGSVMPARGPRPRVAAGGRSPGKPPVPGGSSRLDNPRVPDVVYGGSAAGGGDRVRSGRPPAPAVGCLGSGAGAHSSGSGAVGAAPATARAHPDGTGLTG